MRELSAFGIEVIDHLVQPEQFADITVDSPALTILTDFRSHRPHTVDAHMTAAYAAVLMLSEGASVKLVVNKDGELVGLVSQADLSEQRILATQVETRIKRSDVLVADLMQPRAKIMAIDYEEFQRSTVEDVVATLQRHEQQYYIVVDRAEHHIRGVISSREISKRLHRPLSIEKSPTFVDIFSAVRGQA